MAAETSSSVFFAAVLLLVLAFSAKALRVPEFRKGGGTPLSSTYQIPWTIHQICIKPADPPKEDEPAARSAQELVARNPGWTHELTTDGDAFIGAHFDSKVLKAYQTLRAPAARADLLRLCLLYQMGGVYLDMDSYIGHDMVRDKFVLPIDKLVLFHDKNYKIRNDILAAAPRSPYLKKVIDESVRRIERRVPNIFWTTGPSLLTDVYFAEILSMSRPPIVGFNKALGDRMKKELFQERFQGGRVLRDTHFDIQFSLPAKSGKPRDEKESGLPDSYDHTDGHQPFDRTKGLYVS